MERLKRGDLWTAAGGSADGTKPRPVVIVQDDRFDGTSSITVCPLTSDPTDVPLLRIVIEPSPSNGLSQTSFAMADKITTIPRSRLGVRVGRLAPTQMTALDRTIAVFLGLAGG